MPSPQKGKGGKPATPFGSQGGKPPAPSLKPSPQRAPASWSQAQWVAALPPVLSALQRHDEGAAAPAESVGDDQQTQLAAYMVMLAHWNSTFNLTALRDPQEMLTHHLTDCLAVLTPLGRHLRSVVPDVAGQPVRLLDVGSGGGLPGVVLAIARPDVQVTCVDTVGKKAAFIRQVAAELRLPNLRAEHARVEQLKGRYDLVTSRAFASLNDFVSLTRALLAPGGVWMAMKGRPPDEERAELPADVDVFHVEQLQVPGLDGQRCIVWMRQSDPQTLG